MLTKKQADYLACHRTGPYQPEHYRYSRAAHLYTDKQWRWCTSRRRTKGVVNPMEVGLDIQMLAPFSS